MSSTRYTNAIYAEDLTKRLTAGEQITEEEYKALQGVVGETLAGKYQRASASFFETDLSVEDQNKLFENGQVRITNSAGALD